MALKKCRLCGKVFTEEDFRYCPACRKELGELYGSVHEYMRDHNEENFDIEKLAEGMDIDPAYIKALVDLGYIESLISDKMDQEQRMKLASAFSRELDKKHKDKITTYGGLIYARNRDK